MSAAINNKDRLVFALDVATLTDAKALVEKLGDEVTFYKLGLELMMTGDYFELMDWLLAREKKIFADLKFFDVPATVAAAVRNLRERGATYCTVHGNQSIMEAAAAEKGEMKILGVTALTSLDRGDLDDLGFQCDISELVLSRARRSLEAGCNGVISSGMEVAELRKEIKSDELIVITPGIRPVDNRPDDDQKRVVTPSEALRNGATHIVVGRPIKNAADPRAAAAAIQAEIAEAYA